MDQSVNQIIHLFIHSVIQSFSQSINDNQQINECNFQSRILLYKSDCWDTILFSSGGFFVTHRATLSGSQPILGLWRHIKAALSGSQSIVLLWRHIIKAAVSGRRAQRVVHVPEQWLFRVQATRTTVPCVCMMARGINADSSEYGTIHTTLIYTSINPLTTDPDYSHDSRVSFFIAQ